MATRHGSSLPFTRLRCEALEHRDTPAAVTVIDFGAGFTQAGSFRGMPFGYSAPDLLLTDGPFQARAAWAPDRVHVGSFRTSFVFRLEGEPGRLGDGFTFALTGDNSRAAGTAGAGLGYQGLTDSVAVKFDLVDNAGEGGHSVGVFTGGAEPTMPAVRLDGSPIHLHAQHPIRADLAYDGAVLTVTLTDTARPYHTWTHAFPVDIRAAVGGPTAYVGFTAGTGELFARQAIDSWTFAEEGPDAPTSRPPEINVPAQVSWVSSATVALTARVADDGGPAGLTYTWEVVSAPNGGTRRLPPWDTDPARPIALARLDMGYGLYTFRLTVRDSEGQAATSDVRYDSGTVFAGIEVSPAEATVPAGGTVQFTAVEYDAGGYRVAYPIAPGWGVVGGPGTIDEIGRYTALRDASGTATVEASIPVMDHRGMHLYSVTARATVTILPAPVITSLTADRGAVLGTVTLRASATDDGGPAGLTYTWEVASAPPWALPLVTPSTTDPAAATALVGLGGRYVFRLTVRDVAGLTATREVDFIHQPAAVTSLEVSPWEATIPAGGTFQFVAVVWDQFGNPMPAARPSWEVVHGPGVIDPTGRYTAPADVSGSIEIGATIQAGDPRYPRQLLDNAWVRIQSALPPGGGVDAAGGFPQPT